MSSLWWVDEDDEDAVAAVVDDDATDDDDCTRGWKSTISLGYSMILNFGTVKSFWFNGTSLPAKDKAKNAKRLKKTDKRYTLYRQLFYYRPLNYTNTGVQII